MIPHKKNNDRNDTSNNRDSKTRRPCHLYHKQLFHKRGTGSMQQKPEHEASAKELAVASRPLLRTRAVAEATLVVGVAVAAAVVGARVEAKTEAVKQEVE